MSNVIDTKEGIAFYRLCALKACLGLEIKGLGRKGRSAYSILKGMGYSGSRQRVLEQLQSEVDLILLKREGKQ